MLVTPSDPANNAMLDALGGMLNGGSLELLSGDGQVLATLRLSNPATESAAGGELVFREIFEAKAVIAGRVKMGRLISASGADVFACDVGTEDSTALLKLSTTQMHPGGWVRINSFVLAAP